MSTWRLLFRCLFRDCWFLQTPGVWLVPKQGLLSWWCHPPYVDTDQALAAHPTVTLRTQPDYPEYMGITWRPAYLKHRNEPTCLAGILSYSYQQRQTNDDPAIA